MKSYLIFLSRHKAYTAINVFGLSLSLMFVMLIGLYVYQEKRVGTEFPNADRIELLGMKQDFALDSSQTVGTSAWEGTHHIMQKFLKKRYPEIEKSCGFVFNTINNICLPTGGDFVRANIMMADSTFFSVTGIRLLKGNTATCLQNRNGVVLSERFARRLFGNKEPIGQELQMGQYKWARFHVTGIMPDLDNSVIKHPDMMLNFYMERWSNYSITDESVEKNQGINFSGCTVFLLLREGTTFVNRSKGLTDFVSEIFPKFHTKSIPYSICSEKLTKFYLDPNMETFSGNLRHGNPRLVSILLMATLVLLLFAIINYINLTVALSGRRAREMATRQLFGAPRRTIILKMMGESTLLCFLAYVVALGLAFAFAPVMNQLLFTQLEVTKLLKPLPLLLTIVVVGVMGLISGVIPSMVTSRVKPIEIIKGTFRRQSKMVLGKAFIIFQNVITITMLGVAFVMIAQTRHLINAPMGYNTDNLLVVSSSSFEDTVAVDRFKQLLSQQACVERVSVSYGTPMNGGNNNTLDGYREMVSWQFIVADSAFMDIYGIRPIDGSRPQAGQFYMNKLGETTCSDIMNMEPRELLKKVPLYRTDSNAVYGGRMSEFRVWNILEAPRPLVVYCAKQVVTPWNITIQLKGDPMEGYQTVADIFHTAFHSQMHSDEARFADQQLQDYFKEELQSARITGLFALMAILVSVLGLIAMSTFYIRQRAHDIAIRKVFGSTGMQVRRRLVGTFMRYIVVAIVIAVPITVWLSQHWISQYSYRATWWPWLLVACILVLVVDLAAVSVQSWKASNENPVKNIKEE
jgi:putative ABC transport system permease protein